MFNIIKTIDIEGEKLNIKLASLKDSNEFLARIKSNQDTETAILEFAKNSIVNKDGTPKFTEEELLGFPNSVVKQIVDKLFLLNGFQSEKKS